MVLLERILRYGEDENLLPVTKRSFTFPKSSFYINDTLDASQLSILANNSDNFENIPEENYDCFISGSDQVWNPDWADYTYNKTFLRFCQEKKRISYAASFGVDSIPEKWIEKYRKGLSEFRYLSVRESTELSFLQFAVMY